MIRSAQQKWGTEHCMGILSGWSDLIYVKLVKDYMEIYGYLSQNSTSLRHSSKIDIWNLSLIEIEMRE